MEKSTEQFLDVIKAYSKNHILSNGLSDKTECNYRSYLNSVKEFLASVKIKCIHANEIDENIIDDMKIYLLSNGRGITNAYRTIELCKNSLEWGKMKGKCENKISYIKTKRSPDKEVIHLNLNELQVLIYAQLKDQEEEICKDLYLFQSETGMSYGDLWSYLIIKDDLGEWIFNKRNKTKKEYWVPLTELAKSINLKYNGKLPRVVNKKYNEVIRRVAEKIGIEKYLTTHTARKTFATNMYEKGWSLEAIADMMGITIFVLLRHYIKKSRRRIEAEVLRMNKNTPSQ